MFAAVEKNEILFQIEKYLDEGKKIIIINKNDHETAFWNNFILFINRNSKIKDVLILMVDGTAQDLKTNNKNMDIKLITSEEYAFIKRVYDMYEFSDRISIVSTSSLYPSIFNYLKTGMLTEEEVFETMLRQEG